MSAHLSKEDLWSAVDERSDELIDLCARSIALPAPNPPGDTSAIASFVSDYLSSLGLEVERFEPAPSAPNLIASMGQKGRSHLIVNSHLDTFPAASGAWTFPPFEGTISDGRIYGCGATDMRAGLAASLFIASLITDLGIDLRGLLTLTYSSDEETGGRWGTEWLLNNIAAIRGDACLIGDQNGVRTVAVGEKGVYWMRLSTEGRSSHAAYGSIHSATRNLVRALSVLYTLEDMREASSADRAQPGKFLEMITVNVGKISGGTSPNLVAEHASAEIDVRLPVGVSVEQLDSELRHRLGTEGIDCEIEMLNSFDPTITADSSRIVLAALDNVEKVSGTRPEPVIRSGASDARFFRRESIPTIVYGPTPNNMGAPDEYVEIAELLIVAKVHVGVVLDLLG